MNPSDGPQIVGVGCGETTQPAERTPRSHADRIVEIYEAHADAWTCKRRGDVFEAGWLERFRALMPPFGAVLDIGCGSGAPIAAYLIERQHPVIGVDSSPTMINTCRRRFPQADWRVADMRGLELGVAFSGIIAWDSFFHLCPCDQRGMFDTFRAHSLPGAALMFTSGPAHGEAFGSLEGEVLYHASLSAEEYRHLLAQRGFEVLAHTVQDTTCGGHTIWLARLAQ